MIPRVLEPEVMDTAEEAADYDAMDHAEVNRMFVDDLLAVVRGSQSTPAALEKPGCWSTVLDVGTGTALIPIELCQRGEFSGTVVGIDLAEEMLKVARRNVTEAGLADRVRVELVDAKSLPFEDRSFEVVISNSIVHHIPEPVAAMTEMLRVLQPGGLLFVRDLSRPESGAEVENLVQTYAGGESRHAQQLFRQSLHAALTLEEMQEIAVSLNLPGNSVGATSDRHWTLVGVGPNDR